MYGVKRRWGLGSWIPAVSEKAALSAVCRWCGFLHFARDFMKAGTGRLILLEAIIINLDLHGE
jgi:hypothetical protein